MTRIACSIPLDAPGLRIGHLSVPHSDDAHAYGVIPVPIAVLNGQPGPTMLLAAGVHGDEYEGQIALIVLPACNAPAVRAARRVSPVDGANMNRAFPGDPDGGPTAQIAHYIEAVLLPHCHYALDLHSGGRAAEYTPCAYVYAGGTMAAAKLAMAQAFAAPLALLVGSTAETRSLSAACERAGVPMIATELGGGGALSEAALAVAEDGVQGLLRHAGLLAPLAGDDARRTRCLHLPDRRHFLMSPRAGLFQPAVQLGQTVAEGMVAGWLHDVDDPAVEPRPVPFAAAGIVVARRLPVLTGAGDYLCTTAVPATMENAP
jgi:predicted deacylase